MEGVERYKVRLLPHNPNWEIEYQEVKRQIEFLWHTNLLSVEHVGSTAIHGICAKPILDVAVRLKSMENMDVKALADAGYDYCGPRDGNPNYHLFVMRGKSNLSLRHIHCYGPAEKEFFQLVGFRDFLNRNPDKAGQYEELKQRLAERYPDDRVAYTAGKENFIHSVYEKIDKEIQEELKCRNSWKA